MFYGKMVVYSLIFELFYPSQSVKYDFQIIFLVSRHKLAAINTK